MEKKGVVDSHRLWLIVGIILVVVLVLLLVFYSPLRETVAGRAFRIAEVSTSTLQTEEFQLIECFNVSKLPLGGEAYSGPAEQYPNKASRVDVFVTEASRYTLCAGVLGCEFQGREGESFYDPDVSYSLSNDQCWGTASNCVGNFQVGGSTTVGGVEIVPIYMRDGSTYNTVRKNICESIRTSGGGCYFHDRGGNDRLGDIPIDPGISSSDNILLYQEDACLPFGEAGASCTAGGVSGSWVHSFIPGDYETTTTADEGTTVPLFPPQNTAGDDNSRRTACCAAATACANVQHQCTGRDTEYTYGRSNTFKDFICGDENNWDRCGPIGNQRNNKQPGDASDGGAYVCQQVGGRYEWQLVEVELPAEGCELGSLTDQDTIICSGAGWVSCNPSNVGEDIEDYWCRQITDVGVSAWRWVLGEAAVCVEDDDCDNPEVQMCVGGRCVAREETVEEATEEATFRGDIDEDGSVSSSDATLLLYVLLAQTDGNCGGADQTICDYSDDGIFACDAGTVYVMDSETDLTHAEDTCS